MNTNIVPQNPSEKLWLVTSAWLTMLLVSDFPDIIFNATSGLVPHWLFYYKVFFLALFFGGCLIWQKIRALRPFALIMLVFFLTLIVSDWLANTAWWKGFIRDPQPSFFLGYLRPYLRDTGVTLIVIMTLLIVKGSRKDSFFTPLGQLDAPIESKGWLGIHHGESWRTFGWIFALCATISVAIPTLIGMKLSSALLSSVVPAIPAMQLFAAINAFNEEVCYIVLHYFQLYPKSLAKTMRYLLMSSFLD